MDEEVILRVIEILASLTMMYVCLSPAPSIVHMYRYKHTDSISVFQLVSLWLCNHMWMLYGIVTQNYFPLLLTFGVCYVFSIVFLGVYCHYTDNRRHDLAVVAYATIVNVAALIYTLLAVFNVIDYTQSGLKYGSGYCAIGASFLLYASPLAAVRHAIRWRNSMVIPIGMCSFGVANNGLWVLYSYMTSDLMLFVGTGVNCCVCVFQVIVWIVFHPKMPAGREIVTGLRSKIGDENKVNPGVLETTRRADESAPLLEKDSSPRKQDIDDRDVEEGENGEAKEDEEEFDQQHADDIRRDAAFAVH